MARAYSDRAVCLGGAIPRKVFKNILKQNYKFFALYGRARRGVPGYPGVPGESQATPGFPGVPGIPFD